MVFAPEFFLFDVQACPSSLLIGIISPSSGARESFVMFATSTLDH
jgi:hypothetical protein